MLIRFSLVFLTLAGCLLLPLAHADKISDSECARLKRWVTGIPEGPEQGERLLADDYFSKHFGKPLGKLPAKQLNYLRNTAKTVCPSWDGMTSKELRMAQVFLSPPTPTKSTEHDSANISRDTNGEPGGGSSNAMATDNPAGAESLGTAEREAARKASLLRLKDAAIAARQLPPPDVVPLAKAPRASKRLQVELTDIDDLGFVLIGTPDGKWKGLAGAEWISGIPGYSAEEITSHLLPGENQVIFGVHNKQFAFGPGKWGYKFTLVDELGTIWTQQFRAAGGGVGIRFWKPFFITKSNDGSLLVRQTEDTKLPDVIAYMKTINEKLIKDFGTETSAAGAIFDVFVSATTSSSPNSPGASAADQILMRQISNRNQCGKDIC